MKKSNFFHKYPIILRIMNYELRIMNYGRCRACGTTKSEPERLVGWMLRRFAPLHDVGGVLLRWQR
ncbi:MAG: hypothetical protein IJW31_07300 [Lentisphaeria bacterium]|nr:hypothetical protein [Lentisphaeria bacterium]